MTKLKLHRIVLETEMYLHEKIGAANILGLIGGDCSLCDECAGYEGNPCLFPDESRPSLEALAVDVVGLLKKLNMDAEFHTDKITWTGMVLFGES